MLILEQTSLDLSLNVSDGSQICSKFHYAWLRDNCTCTECLHPDTKERLLFSGSIADDIAPTSANIEGNDLVIDWNQENHHSRFSLDWLQQHDYSNAHFQDDIASGDAVLWNASLENSIPTFSYSEIREDESALLKWCIALRDYGLTIVRGAPLVEKEIERFADYVAVVRETIYDRLHNVRATPGEYNAYNVASTTLELKPHTDMPNYNNPPGVQMFHFLLNESVGGESTAVDGFHIAKLLKEQDPEAYEVLANTPVNFKMFSSKGDIESRNPLLTLNTSGDLKVFRFSNQLAQPANISADRMAEFYSAYKKISRLIDDPSNKVQFRLNTGDIMVTNNLRVMHGRNSYDPSTGGRHLQLSYMDMDDVLSRLRMILKS